VWGCLISVILAAMALGYALGGRAADRSTGDAVVFGAILAAGLCEVAALLAGHPLLRSLRDWPETPAALAAVAVLFGPPTMLLASAAPGIVRLAARGGIGSAAGLVSALGAAGSIGGVLVTSFVLLPHFGTRATLQGLAAVTLALGVVGLLPRRSAGVAGGVAALAVLGASA